MKRLKEFFQFTWAFINNKPVKFVPERAKADFERERIESLRKEAIRIKQKKSAFSSNERAKIMDITNRLISEGKMNPI